MTEVSGLAGADGSIIAKVRALLAKADRSEFEAEREAYYAKAQSLILKHTIEQWQLAPAEREQIVKKIIPLTPKRADHSLLNGVCHVNGVRFLTLSGRGKDRVGWLIGYPSDISFCESLYASLLLDRERELSRAYKPSNEHGKSFNHSFRIAFSSRVYQRLNEFHKASVASEGTGTELVLRDKSRAVTDWMDVNVVGRTHKTASIASRSASGHNAGDDAGRRVDVSGGRHNIGTTRAALSS